MHETVGQQRDGEGFVLRGNRRWQRQEPIETVVVDGQLDAVRTNEPRPTTEGGFQIADDVLGQLLLRQLAGGSAEEQCDLRDEVTCRIVDRRRRHEKNARSLAHVGESFV